MRTPKEQKKLEEAAAKAKEVIETIERRESKYNDPNYKSDFDTFVENMILEEKLQGLLRCQWCGRAFKRLSEYTYEPLCSHYPENIQISVG